MSIVLAVGRSLHYILSRVNLVGAITAITIPPRGREKERKINIYKWEILYTGDGSDVLLLFGIIWYPTFLQSYQSYRYILIASLLLSPIRTIITFLPASNIFFNVGTAIAERILYMPCIGWVMVSEYLVRVTACHTSSQIMEWISQSNKMTFSTQEVFHQRWKSLYFGIVTSICSLVITKHVPIIRYQTSVVWQSEESLFMHAQTICPRSVKVMFNLAIMKRRYSQNQEAIDMFHEILEIDPSYCDVHYNLGITYMTMKQIDLGKQRKQCENHFICRSSSKG
jgi:hypothetical protein